jgi:hypothetical protein
MQPSPWTLYPPGQMSKVKGRREFDVELTSNPEEQNMFSPSIFWSSRWLLHYHSLKWKETAPFISIGLDGGIWDNGRLGDWLQKPLIITWGPQVERKLHNPPATKSCLSRWIHYNAWVVGGCDCSPFLLWMSSLIGRTVCYVFSRRLCNSVIKETDSDSVFRSIRFFLIYFKGF